MKFRLVFITMGALFIGCGTDPKNVGSGEPERPMESRTLPVSVAEDRRSVIVALGDSLTAGLGVDPSESYPGILQKKLDARGYRYRVVNAGVSGDTSSQGLNRLGSVRDQHPEIVVLALGANDGLRGFPVENTYKNLEAIITELQRGATKVLLVGMQMPPNYGLEYTKNFREIFPELARKYHTSFVPFMLEGVAANARFNQEDGVHPTAQGYEIVAENVWRGLEALLDRPHSN